MALERCRRVTAASKLSESRRESELFVGNNAIDATQTRLYTSVVVLEPSPADRDRHGAELVSKVRVDPRRLPALGVRVHVLLPG